MEFKNKQQQTIKKCRFDKEPSRAFRNEEIIIEIKHSKDELNDKFLSGRED